VEGLAGDGLGALSVNSVLDERGVVGDNSLDRMTPVVMGARSAQC
jgi:hypothetical protein